MRYKILGLSDINASRISLGCLHFGTYLDVNESIKLIHWAEGNGVNLIDTGPLYGNGESESIVGKAIRGKRDKYIVSTKVGLTRLKNQDGSFGVGVQKLNSSNIRSSLESSLSKLGTDYIDVFQFHAFDGETEIEESFGVMNDLVLEGKIRTIAASNYSPMQLKAVLRAIEKNNFKSLVALESHYNLIERMVENELLAVCREHGVSTIPYRALARGILTGKYKSGFPFPPGSRANDSWRVSKWITPETLNLVEKLEKFAGNRNRTVTQLALAWLLNQDTVASIAIGARNINQLSECVNSVEFVLSTEDMLMIEHIVDESGQRGVVSNLPPVYFEQ